MSLRPSRSSLFPYTTLFRSPLAGRRAAGFLEGPVRRRRGCDARRLEGPVPESGNRRPGRGAAARGRRRVRRDRKSTRLNSSHLVISYAVFCLKKKNIVLNKI